MPQRDDAPTPRDPQQIIDEQRREIDRLREDVRRSEAERQRLRRENEKLKDELEAARRAVYRQAAPFSRGTRVAAPKRPGRKAGAASGPRAHRHAPTHIDETYEAPLPAQCPHCAGVVRAVRTATQYQEALPVQRPIVRAFHVQIGQCTQCRRRVQGRHPLQTSDALGAAAVQLGPQVIAFALLLNKRFGLPYGKITALLRDRFGLRVSRGGLVHAGHRAARQAQPTYDVLCATMRGSPVVTADETRGASTPTCSGSGPLSRRRRPSMRFSQAAGWPRRPTSSASTIRACCSATGGSRIGNSHMPRTKPVSPICSGAVVSCCSTIPRSPSSRP